MSDILSLEEFKKEIIEKIDERRKDRILETENAEFLIKLINNAETKTDVLKISALGMTYKRTGFHFDLRLEKNEGKTIKYLKKNDHLSFNQGGISHKLIIGDNYPALLNLLINYRKQIKVIYIDPPYGKDHLGEFADVNYDNAITRDNLLSMLYPRLMLAKQLLRDDGIIFCSIDDKNQAYVKCLFDKVFGEENFVACSPRKCAESRTTKSQRELQILHDYVLIYKGKELDEFTQNCVGERQYPYNDDRGKYYIVPLQDNGPHGTQRARPNLYYPIYQRKDGSLSLEKIDDSDIEFLPHMHKDENGTWMWSKKKFESDNSDLTIHNGKVYIKHYYIDGEDTNRYQAYKTWLDFCKNGNGTSLLKSIFDKNVFDNPKPIELIKYLINLCEDKDCIILDFFTGSGTTGQSVLELNREDGGSRQFILVTNNEKTDLNPNGVAYDVTSKRLKRVMTGECYDKTKDFKWLEKNTPYGDSLEVTEIETIPSNNRDIFNLIDEKLYNQDFNGNIQDKIDWVCREFEITCSTIEEKE